MASVAVTVADEVAAYLNGQTVGTVTIPCVRKLMPDLKLANAKSLQALAVPHSLESKVVDRGGSKERVVLVDVGVMKRAPETEFDDLLSLTQSIGDLLENHRFTSGRCTEVSYAPLYDSDIWFQEHCFFAVIVAKIKVL